MFKLSDLIDRCSDTRELLRALALLDEDGAIDVHHEGEDFHQARAAGSSGEDYVVIVDRQLRVQCKCKAHALSHARSMCKHAAAVALRWLRATGEKIDAWTIAPDVARGLEAMTHDDCRLVLIEAAGLNKDTFNRIKRWRKR